eukprot:8936385-Pyramimonas_sp.AAC.1
MCKHIVAVIADTIQSQFAPPTDYDVNAEDTDTSLVEDLLDLYCKEIGEDVTVAPEYACQEPQRQRVDPEMR